MLQRDDNLQDGGSGRSSSQSGRTDHGAGGQPSGANGPGGRRRPGRFSAPGKQTRAATLLLILAILAIIVASGLLVLLLRSLGADEPAPGAGDPPGPAGIHAQDWAALLAVASGPTDPKADLTGYLESVRYADLDGDGSDEAIVLVRTTGTGRYLDYYVYSDPDGRLEILFRQKDISHGQIETGPSPGSFIESRPVYGPGDADCCPSQLRLTTYTWAPDAKAFIKAAEDTAPA